MSVLSLRVVHRLGGFVLDAAFSAPAGVTALFGPSGSGKTSLVRVIGGLLRAREGRLSLGDDVLFDAERSIFVPPHRRRIGTVFQEGRLLPHLTVRQNLMFGRWFAPRAGSGAEPAAVVEMLGLGHLLDRRPAGLSGGETQRVAIGRALLSKPRLLLMDEPLSALDETRRSEILPYIERLRDEIGIPIVYVSHAVSEVARLADTLVVIDRGRVAAAGPASDVLTRLDLGPLAAARESGAVLEARIASQDDYGLTRLETRAGPLWVPRIARPVGSRLRVQIPARDVMLNLARPTGTSALNVLGGVVAAIAAPDTDGVTAEVRLDCNGAPILARITRRSLVDLALVPGTAVFAVIKSVALDRRPGASDGMPRYDGIGQGGSRSGAAT